MSFITNFLSPPPPVPSFTASSLIDLSSKIYIITDCTTQHNIALAKILYNLHAAVYIGTASSTSYKSIANQIKASCPDSKGHLKPFLLDPQGFETILSAVASFLTQEWRLDVLFLDTNASNILSSFTLAKRLLPVMATTASHFCHPNPSIRVIWISNTNTTHIDTGMGFSGAEELYLLAHEFANRRIEQVDDVHAHTLRNSNTSGVQHVLVDQHITGSDLWRSMRRLISGGTHDEDYEACTLLYAGLAPDVRSGDWLIPYGRKNIVLGRIRESIDSPGAAGKGASARLYWWCERRTDESMVLSEQ
jgi:retinol dehydrogenase-12